MLFFSFLLLLNNALCQKITYSNGTCEGDCVNGTGTFHFNTGETYTGSFSNGLRQGQGEYTYKDGSKYKGSFENGVRQGYGQFTCSSYIYKGNFSKDIFKDTAAIMTFFNDPKGRENYRGAVDGVIQGIGTLTYVGDSVYTGSFSNRLRNGYGVLKSKEGVVLKEGEWRNDIFVNSKNRYSPLKYLFLASASYDDLLRLPKGCRRLTKEDVSCLDENGFYKTLNGYAGCAIIDESNKTITISHRGTSLTDIRDLYADAKLASRDVTGQYNSAKSFINCVKEKYINYNFIQTGHSLGGAIAQLAGNEYGDKTVTFDAPGIGIIVKIKNDDITNYINNGSIIGNSSMTGEHLGKIITIFPILPSEETLLNLDIHGRDKIWNAFNPLTEEPWTLDEIIENAWNNNAEIEVLRKNPMPCPVPKPDCFYEKVNVKSFFIDFEDFKKYQKKFLQK